MYFTPFASEIISIIRLFVAYVLSTLGVVHRDLVFGIGGSSTISRKSSDLHGRCMPSLSMSL